MTQGERQRFTLRPGTVQDAPVLLGLFDDAVAWLAEQGLPGQWGTTPFSAVPERVAACRRWAGQGLVVAEYAGVPVGALVLGERTPYVPPVSEPELYVQVLVTSRRPGARGAGAALLAHAKERARAEGAALLRVDCYAGSGGRLVRYYESQGFVRTETFTVDRPDGTPWPGQVLAHRTR